jgi:AcrR family transcriptional regulator
MVAEARARFSARGFAAVSVDEIAAAVGVTKPMIYSYFGSKEGLFAAAVEEAGAELRDAVALAARGDLPPDERLWRGLLAVFAFVDESAEAWDLLYPSAGVAGAFSATAAAAQEAMAELLSELFAEVAIEQGVEAELARTEAAAQGWAMTGATIAAGTFWRRHPQEPRELHALRLMNFAWQGLGNVLEQRIWLPPPVDSARLATEEGDARFAERVRMFRDAFLEDAFRRMPDHFLSARAGGRAAVIEWQITGRPDGGHDTWQVVVEDGRCTVVPEGGRQPSVRLRLDDVDFLHLALGHVTGPALFARGRLSVRRRPFLALRVAGWFQPPTV